MSTISFIRRFAALSVAAGLAFGIQACDDDGTNIDDDDPDILNTEVVAEGLTAPLTLMESPDGTDRLFVVDQVGQIRIIDANGDLLAEPFLDLSGSIVELSTSFDERGLLGMAFHPQYASNGRFFVYYSAPLRAGAPAEYNHTATISEFQVSANANVADAASERVILEVDEPQFNHNGGTLAFGPDGYLYISLGDGGGGDDVGTGHVPDWYEANEGGNGQDVEANLLGSILRIDVDSGDPYGIPADNPFVGDPGLDEIYAYGFRNPYRMSFDMGDPGVLLVGDAGQDLYEEVSLVTRGGNYGWNVKEGTHCFSTADPETPLADCPETGEFGEPLIDPVIEYENAKDGDGLGIVVVGGYVYRGTDLANMEGLYVFGDWSTSFTEPDGLVLVAAPTASGLWEVDELRFGPTLEVRNRLNAYVMGFGQDLEGEIYILTSNSTAPTGNTGRVLRMTNE